MWIESIGHLLLAGCAIPAAIQAIVTKRSDVPWTLIVPWLLGEIGAGIGAIDRGLWPAVGNYLTNILCLGIIVFRKVQSE